VSLSIPLAAFLVRDYDEAIAFFEKVLCFHVVESKDMGRGKRWVVVAPPGSRGASLLLAKAATPEQLAQVGNQAGGRVFLFLHSSDFWSDYHRMRSMSVEFLEEPRKEEYGIVAVFKDLYGNKWDLLQPT